jgi:hypothetical protein
MESNQTRDQNVKWTQDNENTLPYEVCGNQREALNDFPSSTFVLETLEILGCLESLNQHLGIQTLSKLSHLLIVEKVLKSTTIHWCYISKTKIHNISYYGYVYGWKSNYQIESQPFKGQFEWIISHLIKKLGTWFESYFQGLWVYFWDISIWMQNKKIISSQNCRIHNL